MTYDPIVNGETLTAEKMNTNFLHVGQGDRLPWGGSSLETTTGVYDIGSEDYKFNYLHCNNFRPDAVKSEKIFTRLAEEYDTGTTSEIQITGLNGDDSEVYYFTARGHEQAVTTTVFPAIYLFLNQLSTGAYQENHFQFCPARPTLTSSEQNLNFGRISIAPVYTIYSIGNQTVTSECVFMANGHIYAKTGKPRVIISDYMHGRLVQDSTGANITYDCARGQIITVLSNTAATITSIKIVKQSTLRVGFSLYEGNT